jgi:hypothetical protein
MKPSGSLEKRKIIFNMELWKNIEGTNGTHSVSNLGKVRSNDYYAKVKNGQSLVKSKIRKPQKNGVGYHFLIVNRFYGQITIHRLVALHFIPNPDNKLFVNHINGIKTDNRVENLEWVTRQENEDHAYRTGLKNSTGSNNTMSKLNESDVLKIRNMYPEKNAYELAKVFGVHRSTIERIVQNKIWNHI